MCGYLSKSERTGPMKVSKQFLKDFAYIANLYAWTTADIEDVKAQTRASPVELGRYWTRLAAGHRAGYEQNGANNFVRLEHWEQAGASSVSRNARPAGEHAHARRI
jgi:hypothetical protein